MRGVFPGIDLIAARPIRVRAEVDLPPDIYEGRTGVMRGTDPMRKFREERNAQLRLLAECIKLLDEHEEEIK